MNTRVLLISTLMIGLLTGSAVASSIGIFFSADGSDCDATVLENTAVTWYICAVLGGDAGGSGITGAEFRQDGTPAGWFMTPAYSPAANVSIGLPTTGGCNLAFPDCKSGGIVLLYTVSGFATTSVSDMRLQIHRHTNPSNPHFPCPLLVLCDGPTYTKICVPGGEAIINGPPCTVGIQQKSWGAVKSLYGH